MLALALAACGYPQEDYVVEFPAALCDHYERCEQLEDFGFASTAECVEATEPNYSVERRPCETYQPKEAEACVLAMESLECQEGVLELPEACGRVCP